MKISLIGYPEENAGELSSLLVENRDMVQSGNSIEIELCSSIRRIISGSSKPNVVTLYKYYGLANKLFLRIYGKAHGIKIIQGNGNNKRLAMRILKWNETQ